MISRLRESVFTKIFWGLMGLYLLNISVDAADPNPEHVPEDLSFNDQESIVEIIVEQVLGFEDAIDEYDDQDPQDQDKKKNVKTDLVVNVINAKKHSYDLITSKKTLYPDSDDRLINGFLEIDSPPPKV